MTGPCLLNDRTNFLQSLMHMVKGNLGTGILAMPNSFSHTGLIGAIIGLPMLCIIATYCVHLIIRSTVLLQSREQISKDCLSYATLAKESFRSGPRWMRTSSGAASVLVDAILLVAQFGVCCVYIVFVVDNIITILATYDIKLSKTMIYTGVFPIALGLSFIRTLKRLAIASACANLLQVAGIACVLEYLLRDMNKLDLSERDNFRPLDEVALGFGSAMFAFEGISVVLPVYLRMRNQEQMSGILGLINVSYGILLILYFCIGLFGYIRFGRETKDSITLNLPPEPIYDVVRAMFATSVLLTYPLQFYVPNEIVWNWARRTLLMVDSTETITTTVIDIRAECDNKNNNYHANGEKHLSNLTLKTGEQKNLPDISRLTLSQLKETSNCDTNKSATDQTNNQKQQNPATKTTVPSDTPEFDQISCQSDTIVIDGSKQPTLTEDDLLVQDYFCRTVLVSLTFILAISVPKLDLLMDFIGSVTGTSLSLIIPGLIHIGSFWNETDGFDRFTLVGIDVVIIMFGIIAGASGSISSLSKIIHLFNKPNAHHN